MLVWDATCPDTYAPSHISIAVRGAGAVAAQAERLKMTKYEHLDSSHFFVPFAVETSRVLREAAEEFVGKLGRCLYRRTPQSRVPSATHFNRHAEGKCRCSPQHHGGSHSWTAGSDFCMLIQLHDYVIIRYVTCKIIQFEFVFSQKN